MSGNRVRSTLAIVLAAIGWPAALTAQEQPPPGADTPVVSPTAPAAPVAAPLPPAAQGAAAAIDRAAKSEKYIFLFFFRTEDEPTQAARATFEAAVAKLADRAESWSVSITDPQEQALVRKFGLNRAPMPLVLVLAPNGAVTRSFPGSFTDDQLQTAFVSVGVQKCLKALQDRKMAFVCIQNGTTQHNGEAMRGVTEFAADPRYAGSTQIVLIDPGDPGEVDFLRQLRVDPRTREAITVLLAPPGRLVGTFRGEVKKDALVAALQPAAGGCSPASGCCPAPKKP